MEPELNPELLTVVVDLASVFIGLVCALIFAVSWRGV